VTASRFLARGTERAEAFCEKPLACIACSAPDGNSRGELIELGRAPRSTRVTLREAVRAIVGNLDAPGAANRLGVLRRASEGHGQNNNHFSEFFNGRAASIRSVRPLAQRG
jgi:hypothetical protein